MQKIKIACALFLAVMAVAFINKPSIKNRIAGAPKMSIVDVMPTNGSGDVVYLTMAPPTSKGSAEGLLSVRAEIRNNETKDLVVNRVTIECKGGGKNIIRSFQASDAGKVTIKKGKSFEWQNNRDYHELGDVIKFSSPFPNQLSIKFFFDNYDQPYVITKNLKGYLNNTAGNGYAFPAKDEDLLMNEYWYADAAHGGGGQVFGYDMSIVGWDEDTKTWSEMKKGKTKDENKSFRVYGRKIYSVTDGEVLEFINNWAEAPSTSDTGTAGGNRIKINNGKETICYYHMQPGSINKNLLKIGAKIKKGDFIGLVGNSGNSSGPHLHIHAIADPDKDGQGPFIPLQFSDIYAIDVKSLSAPDPNADWVRLSKIGLPYVEEDPNRKGNERALVWPDAKKPCWYPYNLAEITKHGIPESKYQEEVSKIWSCGYYPVWVDAYDVAGKTFFNAVFRYNKNGYEVSVRHDMTRESFLAEYKEWVDKKAFRLQQMDSYNDAGKLKFAAIFIKRSGQPQSQPAYAGLTPDEHQTLFEKYTGDGYVPVNVSVISVGGKKYYSAFYEKKDVGGSLLKSFLSQQEYQDKYDEMAKKNWEQVYINAYHHDGETRFSVIWYEKSGYKEHSAVRKSSNEAYQEKWEDNLADGLLTRCITGYDEGGKHWFAAYWAK